MGTLASPVARHKDSNSVTYLISHNNGCYWLRECVNTQLNPEDLCMHTHICTYIPTLFTLYLSTLWHSLQACLSKKLGISFFMAPWNELLVKLLLKP